MADRARCVFLADAAALLLGGVGSGDGGGGQRRGGGGASGASIESRSPEGGGEDGPACEAMAAHLLAPLGSTIATSKRAAAAAAAASATSTPLGTPATSRNGQAGSSVFSPEMADQVCRCCGAVFALQPPRCQRRPRQGKRRHTVTIKCSCCGVTCWQGKAPRTAGRARRKRASGHILAPSPKPRRAVSTPLVDPSMLAGVADASANPRNTPSTPATPHHTHPAPIDKQPEKKQDEMRQGEGKRQKQQKKSNQRKKQALQHILGRGSTPGGKKQKKKRKSKGGQDRPALTLQDVLQQCNT